MNDEVTTNERKQYVDELKFTEKKFTDEKFFISDNKVVNKILVKRI